MDISAIILAGGGSRRMGTDKASLVLDGETLLARTTRITGMVTDDVLIIGRLGPAAIPGVRYVADDLPDAGPLGGILTGLRRAGYPYAAVVASDMPFLRPEIIDFLRRVVVGYEAAVPRVGGRAHPALAVYGRTSVDAMERRIARGELRLRALLDDLRVRWVEEDEIRRLDPGLDSLRNVNTPRDWEETQQRVAQHQVDPAVVRILRSEW